MLSHRQGWSVGLVLFVFSFVFFTASANETPTATYRTGASEVRVTFFATDQNDHPVEKIGKDDFAIVDGETVIRNFRSLTRTSETALDVVAVVDSSGSVAPRFRTTMNDVLQLASREQFVTDDGFSVLSYNGARPLLLCNHDCRSPDTRQRLLTVKAAGPTPLFDTLTYAADIISARRKPEVRQILILFSDGNDNVSINSARDALEAVLGSGALLYVVDLNKSPASEGSAFLERLAEATGGRSFSVQDGAAGVLQAALTDLRASYVVTYPLPNRVAGFHSLRILPKHNQTLRFHCRRGYYYGDHR